MTEVQSKWQDRTRGGYPVRIYNEDANILHHIHGAMACSEHGQMNCASWRADGHYFNTNGPYDLMPIPKKKRVFKTLNELANEYSFFTVTDGVIQIQGHSCHIATLASVSDGLFTVNTMSGGWLARFTKEVDDV